MTGATVHQLHRPVPPPAAFLRVGHTGHHRLEALLAADRLAFRRLVFDAAHLHSQRDLLSAASRAGFEIVLDLNVAESAALSRVGSAISKLPWANPDRPWTPADFAAGRNDDLFKRMAEFVVSSGAHVVLGPSHAFDDEGWVDIDRDGSHRLRDELDQAGAADVAIDHLAIVGARELRDPDHRRAIVTAVGNLPIQNLWLRIGGFGATATGVGTRHVIEASRSLLEVSRPLILDMAGGFAALAPLAFGAIGGISHGVAQRESFDLAAWRKPPVPRKGGGTPSKVYLAELDRYLDVDQAAAFFAVRGTKARFSCSDGRCCPSGIEDMTENANAHFLTQRHKQVDALAAVPETRRAEHFLLHQLDPALRSARQASKLKFGDEKLQKVVADTKGRLGRLRDVLGALHEADAGVASRSRAPSLRGNQARQETVTVIRGAVS